MVFSNCQKCQIIFLGSTVCEFLLRPHKKGKPLQVAAECIQVFFREMNVNIGVFQNLMGDSPQQITEGHQLVGSDVSSNIMLQP